MLQGVILDSLKGIFETLKDNLAYFFITLLKPSLKRKIEEGKDIL